jgi:hypothetical protein
MPFATVTSKRVTTTEGLAPTPPLEIDHFESLDF